jgi:hypothetical protein
MEDGDMECDDEEADKMIMKMEKDIHGDGGGGVHYYHKHI